MRRPAVWAAGVLVAGTAAASGQGLPAAAAQQRPTALQLPLPLLTGAGGDPRTAVGQAQTSDQVSVTIGASIQSSLGPYGDPFGIRAFLAARGITYVATYIGEGLGNLRGGLRRGSVYGGRLDFGVDLDLERLAGWEGARVHGDFFQIHGHGLTAKFVDNLTTVSGIEAVPTTRLFELWLEQRVLGDQLSLKLGQISADTEFAIAQSGVVFLNAGFGWPNIRAVILPSGGPIYPLATPAIRAKYVPNPNFSLQAGLFNGDPAGRPRPGEAGIDPERRNPHGTSFRVSDPPFAIAEAAYAYNIEPDAAGLPGTATLGAWHHFGRFSAPGPSEPPRDAEAPPPAGVGIGVAGRFRGNAGLYAILDQTLYREPGTADEGASAFVRFEAVPADRNLVDLYVDTGLAYKGLLPGRGNDTLGLGLIVSRISPAARAFDRAALPLGRGGPLRSSEAVIELTYQAEIVPGFTLQPDLQYVMRPGGGIADAQGRRLRNAAVLGLRATINY